MNLEVFEGCAGEAGIISGSKREREKNVSQYFHHVIVLMMSWNTIQAAAAGDGRPNAHNLGPDLCPLPNIFTI
jgi:hypothetical protein